MPVHNDGSASLKPRRWLPLHHCVFAGPLLGLRVYLLQISEAVFFVQVVAERTCLNPCRHEQPVGQIRSPFHLN